MSRPVALVCLMALMAGACSESSPAAPTPTSPAAGTWVGTVSGEGATRTVRLTLIATSSNGDASVVGGRYESTSASGAAAGEVGGVVAGGRVSLTFTPAPPVPCSVAQPFPADQWLLNLVLDGPRMSGDGAITVCGGSGPAQAAFTRQ